MAEMSDEVLNMFENPECDKQKALTWIATVTDEGDPHLNHVCFVKPIGKEKLLIGATFMLKTLSNIKEGSKVERS